MSHLHPLDFFSPNLQRKVKFQFELDVIDLVTPTLKEKLQPLNAKLRKIEKEREERRKTRRKSKAKAKEDAAVAAVTSNTIAITPVLAVDTPDIHMADASGTTGTSPAVAPPPPIAGVLEDEAVAQARENEILRALIDPELAADVGSSPHGLYELYGEWIVLVSFRLCTMFCDSCCIGAPLYRYRDTQRCISGWWSLYWLGEEGCY